MTGAAKVAEVLRRLPVLAVRQPEIDRVARKLTLISELAAANDLPRANRARPGAAAKEVDRLLNLADELRAHILAMHRDALEVFEPGPRHPLVIADDLHALIVAAGRAPAEGKSGRPPKRRAADTARYAAKVYQYLTGRTLGISTRNGKACGPFVTFLDSLFDALEIDASAAAQARAVKDMEKKAEK